MNNKPLVTCICPTTEKRLEWLPKAVECFLSQTYENKEMLIMFDGALPFSEPPGPGVRMDALLQKHSLGIKRGACVRLARGELIAHFDDDDFSASDRLAFQVDRLVSTGAQITGLSRMRFTDGKDSWRYIGVRDWPLGTSLMYRRDWAMQNPFRDVHVGSDTLFIQEAQRQKVVDVVPAGDMMVAWIHPDNTNKRNYSGPSWEKLCV